MKEYNLFLHFDYNNTYDENIPVNLAMLVKIVGDLHSSLFFHPVLVSAYLPPQTIRKLLPDPITNHEEIWSRL